MLDQAIVLLYLAVTLVVGLYAGKNIKGIKDYAVASRKYPTPVLVVALLATVLGGASTIGITEKIYMVGIIFTLASIGSAIADLLMAKFLAPKMDRFIGMISVGEMMDAFYGKTVRIITGITGGIFCAGLVGTQIIAMGYLFEVFFGIPSGIGILIGGAIIVIYSSFGGVKAVTVTDVIQFAILIVIIPIVSNVAINEVGGVGKLIEYVPDDHLSILDKKDLWTYFVMFIIWAFPTFMLSPPLIQRFLMAKKGNQIANILYISMGLRVPFAFMMAGIGLSALILYPEIDAKLALPQVINDILPVGIKGMAMAGMLAVVMSTADSFLNSSGILMVHDVINPLRKKKISSKHELRITRISTVLIGALAVFLSTKFQSIIDLALYTEGFIASVVTVPLAVGILGFKSNSKSFVSGMVLALITLIGFPYAVGYDDGYTKLVAGILANIIGFFGSHYIQNRKTIITRAKLVKKRKTQFDLGLIFKTIVSYIPTLEKMNDYSTSRVEYFGAQSLLFGIFACINYIIPYFMWSYTEPDHYPLVLAMRMIAGLLCVVLLLKDYWPRKWQKYFPLYWHATLLYCLPFVTTYMLIQEHGSVGWLLNMALAIFLLAVLVDWLSFVIILPVGILLGYAFYTQFIGNIYLAVDSKTLYIAIYMYIFSTLIGLIFTRKREIAEREKLETMKLFGGAMAHEVKTPLASVGMSIDLLKNIFSADIAKKDTKDGTQYILSERLYEMIQQLPDTLIKVSQKGLNTIEMLLMGLKDKVVAEDIGEYSITECVNDAIGTYNMSGLERKKVKFKKGNDFKFTGSKHFMVHVLYNLLQNAFKHTRHKSDAIITIWLEKNRLYFKDTGPGIPVEILPHIFKQFYTQSKTGTGIGLAFCDMVMKDIGGTIKCKSKEDEYCEFILEFPK